MHHFVDSELHIDFTKSNLTAAFLKDLTYPNPEYFQKMNMGLSVKKIPKEIRTYTLDTETGMHIVMRGEYGKVHRADPSIVFEEQFSNHPIALQYINNDFPLDEYQEEAVEMLKERRQGVVHAVTSAGKSLMILKAICELGQRAVIIVHRKFLMQQFLEDIDKYVRDGNGEKISVGIIGDGKKSIGAITIAIDKTLARNIGDYAESFGVVFMDECHIAPTLTMLSVINRLRAERRYGFSGTLRRKDQKEFIIFALFGPVIYAIGKDQLLDKGRIVPVVSKVVHSPALFDYESVVEAYGITRAHQMMEGALMTDPFRNKLILDLVAKLKGTKTIILSKYVQPCFDLSRRLQEEYGLRSGVVTGRKAKQGLAAINEMKNEDLEVIFATVGCISAGLSISDLNNIVLITPIYTNELLLHQIRGRLMRKSEGKDHGTLYFIYDAHVFEPHKLSKFLTIMEK